MVNKSTAIDEMNKLNENKTKVDSLTPKGGQSIPKATHIGTLPIGDMVIPCAVLEPREPDKIRLRVLSERGVAKVFGKTGRGSPSWYRQRGDSKGPTLPFFISAKNLIPYIPSTVLVELTNPIIYKGKNGAKTYGIDAKLLGDICKVWIEAHRAGALNAHQEHIAQKAEVLRDALVGVALVSLVDDATGYVQERDRDELQKILEAYISSELLAWTRKFPNEFYEHLFRLRGWEYSPPQPKRPKYVGKLTNELIYEKLPPGVLDELRAKNPVTESGHRRYKFFQFLTEDIGNEHLGNQLAAVTTLMKVSNSWSTFRRLFDRAFPKESYQAKMRFDSEFEDEGLEIIDEDDDSDS